MKTYTIDINNRESLIETLWNEIEANPSKEVCFVCAPNTRQIGIHEDIKNPPIAIISFVKVSDEYDVKNDIFIK